ncbi:MAG: type II toxin-antitoxin system Phd/YefM family antitoxin [Acidobacteriota bacterium]
MKRVSASEARKNWFRLLDEAAAGEVVVIDRKGKRIVLKQECPDEISKERIPDYTQLLRVSEPEQADQWRWEWLEEGLIFVPEGRR